MYLADDVSFHRDGLRHDGHEPREDIDQPVEVYTVLLATLELVTLNCAPNTSALIKLVVCVASNTPFK